KSYIYLKQIAVNLNTMGVQLSNDSIPLVTRLASFEQVNSLRIGDTVVAINGISFLSPKDEHFNKSIYPRTSEFAKIPGFEMVPPLREIIISNFNKLSPYSTMKIKRGDSTWTFRLIRY